MQIESPSSKGKAESSLVQIGIYYEQRRIGHVLAHGDEAFEAFDQTERTLGIFKSEDEAATAIWKAAQ
jgi:hypothetical protein